MKSAGVKPGTGQSSSHGLNRQNERGAGVKNNPLKKSMANPNPPNVAEAKPASKGVKMAPKINEGTGGQPDGAKRIIQNEASPSKTSSTYRAPRSNSGGSDPYETGYSKLGKV